MPRSVWRDIFAVMKFEWKKRYQFPIIEIVLVIMLFESFPRQMDFSTSLTLQEILPTVTTDIQAHFYSIDLNFLVIALIITILVTMSLGRDFETDILKTTLVQARMSRRTYLIGKVCLDVLLLILAFVPAYILYTFMYGALVPVEITRSFYIFYFSKILLAYGIALLATVWRKQMLQPLLISLLFWFSITIGGATVINENYEPWHFFFNLSALVEEAPHFVNSLLMQFTGLLLCCVLLLFLGASYIYQNTDLV